MVCLHHVLLLSVLYHLCYGEYNHSIYIDPRPTIGKDTPQCITSNNPSFPCKTLNWTFLPEHRSNSLQYVFLNGPNYLNNSIETFKDLNNIAFVGNEMQTSSVLIHCGTQEAGLAFFDVTNISFSRLTFENCSATRNSTSRDYNVNLYRMFQFKVALYFYHCRNVHMYHVEITKSPNAMGVVMYDTDGVNTITQCAFTDNVLVEGSENPGGGGFYVEFSYCVPGDSTCNQANVPSYESRNSEAHYIFSECSFKHNQANASSGNSSSAFVIPYRANHQAFGRGGGLSIFLKGNSTGNKFDIIDCVFDSNQALWGGGLFIELQDDTRGNTIQVSNSTFTNNTCYFTTDIGTSGGGMGIGHYVYGYDLDTWIQPSTISVEDCNFTKNAALNGGGLSLYASLQTNKNYSVTTVNISDTNFIGNIAKLGSAMHFDRFPLIVHGNMLMVYIFNGIFEENTVEYAEYFVNNAQPQIVNSLQPQEVGLGAVYTHEIELTFLGSNTNFTCNKGTALAAISTSLDFTNCETVFDSNHGLKGGAITLLGSAFIKISNATQFGIYRNTATVHGGGIYNQYIARENLKSYTDCFLRYVNPFVPPNKWKATFYFFNNTDQGGTRKNAIYTTSVFPCSFTAGSDKDQIFFWDGWDYPDEASPYQMIATDIGDIDYTGINRHTPNSVKAFPGIPFDLPLIVVDDYDVNISSESIFSASTNTSNSNIGEYNLNFTFVQGESTIVEGSENQSVVLQLDNLGNRVWHTEVIVELVSCPPGFKANDSNGAENTFCDCSNSYGGVLQCDADSFKAQLRNGNWLGQLEEGGQYLSAVCPPGYCYETLNHSTYYLLPKDPVKLNELICGNKSRNGTLCGRCIEGFGPAVNSLTYECVNCTDENIAANVFTYIASVYIPLTILFTILILFDIRLTTGPANAFILYCQVVASTFDLNAGGQIPLNLYVNNSDYLVKAYHFPYGIFNLEFVENFLPPLCLGTGLNNLSVFFLDYAVAFYPLLMIIIVIVCVRIRILIAPMIRRRGGRQWERLTSMSFSVSSQPLDRGRIVERKGISDAVLPAFAAFLLLSYTKFTLASAYILSYRQLINEDGYINTNETPTRVYFAGHYAYDSKDYLVPYFLPACLIFATVVIITPVLLLDYPVKAMEWILRRVNCLWKFYPVDKVHLLLEMFQGCYKKRMKFFAGLYFIFRLTICVIYLAIDTWLDQFIVQQIACVAMVVLLATCQPYNEENRLFNYVDIILFLNLAAVNVLSLYLYAYTQNYPNVTPSVYVFAIQYILVFLPLIYMICYIVWRVTRPCHHKMKIGLTTFYRKLKSRRYRDSDNVTGASSVTPGVFASGFEGNDDPAAIEAILARAELENTYRPSPVVCDSVESSANVVSEDKRLLSDQSDSTYGYTRNSNSPHNSH